MCERFCEAIELAANDEAERSFSDHANGKVFSSVATLADAKELSVPTIFNPWWKRRVGQWYFLCHRNGYLSQWSWVCGFQPKALLPICGCGCWFPGATENLVSSKLLWSGLAPDAGGLYLPIPGNWWLGNHLVMTERFHRREGPWIMACSIKSVKQKNWKNNRTATEEAKRVVSCWILQGHERMVWKSLFSGWKEYAELELALQKSLAFTEDFKEGSPGLLRSAVLNLQVVSTLSQH